MEKSALHDLTVVMATCDDDPRVLALVLDAVIAQPLDRPLVIVDMSRGNGVRRLAEPRQGAVRYISYPESTGLSDSRNRLVESADGRYVLFIDADAVPAPGWARAMRRAFDVGDGTAVVGARCVPVWHAGTPLLFDTAPALDLLGMFDLGSERLDVPRIMGTSFALDRERLPGTPPFSPLVGRRPGSLFGIEEVAFCAATRARGWRIRYEPEAVVRHHVRPERARWSWMLRRAFVAGQESLRTEKRLERLPRSLQPRDYLFLAAIAPWFLAGRLSDRAAAASLRRGLAEKP